MPSSSSESNAAEQHPDGLTIARFCQAAKGGDVARLREMIRARPELLGMDLAGDDEHRAIHFAVLCRHPQAVRVLMEAGADARKGIYPNRDATTAFTIAADRGYDEIVEIIEQAEQHRRERASCPNATVAPVQDRISAAIRAGQNDEAIGLVSADTTLIRACDRDGGTPLHVAAEALNEAMVQWLLGQRSNVQKTDTAGRTPLDRAAFSADPRKAHSLERFAAVAGHLRWHGAPLTLAAAIALDERQWVGELFGDEPSRFVLGAMQLNA